METPRRALIIDPSAASRAAIEAALAGGPLSIAAVCPSYAEAPGSVATSRCDLALVVLDPDPEPALEAIRALRSAVPQVAVLPVSRSRDGEMILRALRAGAHEFLTLPIDPTELREAVGRLLPGAVTGGGRAPILTLIGTAGGVGCTTLAVNLACCMARSPAASVAVVDLDLLLGAVDTSLDLVSERTIADVAADVARYDETLLRRALARHESGVHVLAAPTAIEDAARVDPESVHRILELLRRSFSIVLVDASKGFQATDFAALELSDTILMVSQLDVCGLRNGARLMQVLRQFDGMAERVRVAMNRVGSTISTVGVKKAEETLGAPVGWQVPNDSAAVAASRSKGVPLIAECPKSRATRAIVEMAEALAPTEPVAAAAGPPLGKKLSKLSKLSSMFT